MLYHGVNHHYRDSQKNLFLGEGLRVFAHVPEGDDAATLEALQAQPANNQAHHQSKPGEDILEALRKMVPGPIPPYDKDSRYDTGDVWNQRLELYRQVQDRIKKIGELRLNISPTDEQWKHKWEEYLKNENMARELLEGKFGSYKIDRKNVYRDLKEKQKITQSDIEKHLNGLQKDYMEVRDQILKEMEKMMKDDFRKRLDYLIHEWDTNPPKNFSHEVVDSWIEFLEAVKKKVDTALPPLRSTDVNFGADSTVFQYYRRAWDEVLRAEDTLKEMRTAQEHGLDTDVLTKRLNDLDKKKKQKVDVMANAYRSRTDDVIRELRQLREEIDRAPYFKDDHGGGHDDHGGGHHKEESPKAKEKRDRLETIDKTITALEGSRDLDTAFDETINGPKDAKDNVLSITKTIGEGKDKKKVKEPLMFYPTGHPEGVPVPKSLRDQINFINSLPLHPAERQQMIYNLSQSLDRLEGEMEEVPDRFARLSQMLVDIRRQRGSLSQKKMGKKFQVVWLAPASIKHILHAVENYFPRQYDRIQKYNTSKFGEAATELFKGLKGPLSHYSGLSGEFAIEAEHAEHEGYSHYQKQHEHATIDHMLHVVHTTKLKDELRGTLLLLSQHGRIRWDDPLLLKQLNYFARGKAHVDEDPLAHYANQVRSEKQKEDAFYAIWGDVDLYRTLRSQNYSNIESKKSNYMREFGPLCETAPDILPKMALEILSEHKKSKAHGHEHDSHRPTVDPLKYEALIDYSIQQGKMSPEMKFYLLIQGISSGLLPMERGSEFTKYNNAYPPIEFFAERGPFTRAGRPQKQDIDIVAQMDYATFLYFFHTYVMHLDKVQQRIDKALSGGTGNRLDHDDVTPNFAYMSATVMEGLLRAQGDGFRLPSTGYQNGLVGMLFYMDHLGEAYDRIPKAEQQLQRFIHSYLIFDGITNNRMHAGDSNYFHFDENMKGANPRNDGLYKDLYGRKNMNTEAHMEVIRSHLQTLDEGVFGPLFDGSINQEGVLARVLAHIQSTYGNVFLPGQEPKNVDQFYQNIGQVLKVILTTGQGPSRVTAMLARVHQSHTAFFEEQDKLHEQNHNNPGSIHTRWHAFQHQRSAMQGSESASSHGEAPAEGDDGATNNNFHYSSGQSASGSTHGQHDAEQAS